VPYRDFGESRWWQEEAEQARRQELLAAAFAEQQLDPHCAPVARQCAPDSSGDERFPAENEEESKKEETRSWSGFP
jgi:hypothetical protein